MNTTLSLLCDGHTSLQFVAWPSDMRGRRRFNSRRHAEQHWLRTTTKHECGGIEKSERTCTAQLQRRRVDIEMTSEELQPGAALLLLLRCTRMCWWVEQYMVRGGEALLDQPANQPVRAWTVSRIPKDRLERKQEARQPKEQPMNWNRNFMYCRLGKWISVGVELHSIVKQYFTRGDLDWWRDRTGVDDRVTLLSRTCGK